MKDSEFTFPAVEHEDGTVDFDLSELETDVIADLLTDAIWELAERRQLPPILVAMAVVDFVNSVTQESTEDPVGELEGEITPLEETPNDD